MILSIKNLVFKNKLARKLTEQYDIVGLYAIEKVVSTNIVKLRLLALMRIYSTVNINKVVRYKKQKIEKIKSIKRKSEKSREFSTRE